MGLWGLCSIMSAVTAATGQAQPTRAQPTRTRMRIYWASPIIPISMRRASTIATAGYRCALCAWLQNDETSEGHGDRYIGSLFRVDEPVPDDSFNPSQYNVIDSAI